MHQNIAPDSLCNPSFKLLTDLSWPGRFYSHVRLDSYSDQVVLSCLMEM